MTSETGTSQTTPQARVCQRLGHATELSQTGKRAEAVTELETALLEARNTPYEIEFQTRIQLIMTLADIYCEFGDFAKARDMLTEEAAFAEKISQIIQLTGTQTQKRAATSGYLQVRDRATQMELIGEEAPEITVKTWIQGGPLDLEDLRGKVVLLEFWATWCKPCQEMFPKLKHLYAEHAKNGLEIIGLTRHYMAYRGTAESMGEELELIRGMIKQHAIEFPVGVAEDERLQAIYGANGLPTAILLDRHGVVRYAGPGIEERTFQETLEGCLKDTVSGSF